MDGLLSFHKLVLGLGTRLGFIWDFVWDLNEIANGIVLLFGYVSNSIRLILAD